MKSLRLESTPLKDIVSRDSRAAAVLDRYQLDYCCGGAATLEEGCRQRGVSVDQVVADLEALNPESRETREDDPIALIAHIVDKHHAYVRQSLPVIRHHLARIVAAHGIRHPELARVELEFSTVADELSQHLVKEEQVLFPYIASLTETVHHGAAHPPDMFGTVQNPIRMMEIEHQNAGDAMASIRGLTRDYEVPDDGCATYRLAFNELEAFERDLHTHVHLENNVLFPAAIALEQRAHAS